MAKRKTTASTKNIAPAAKQVASRRPLGCTVRNIIIGVAVLLVLSALGRGTQNNSTRPTPTARQQVAQVNESIEEETEPTNTTRPMRITSTARPTTLPTETDAAEATQNVISTSTSRPTSTITNTVTRQPATNTAPAAPTTAPTEAQAEVFETPLSPRTYYVRAEARVRTCPSATDDCAVINTLTTGLPVNVVGIAIGSVVSGSDQWYMIDQQGITRYVHSSLVSDTFVDGGSGSGSTGSGSSGNPGNLPINTQVIVSTPPQTTSFVCDCSKTCSQIATCEEAYFQLNQCGCSERDGDNPPDGIPCESLCL